MIGCIEIMEVDMNVIDFFAGCGGMSLGFQDAGANIVAAFEKWEPAAAVYEKNFLHPVFRSDLSEVGAIVAAASGLEFDTIIGGPPCQDFSQAGRRREGDRADLTISFAEIIAALMPRWFVMENVPRIQKSGVFKEAASILMEAGYGLSSAVLDASHYGVPQARKRFFLIGENGGADGALLPYMLGGASGEPMTVSDYLGDSLGLTDYYRHPTNYQRRGIFSIHEPSPTIRGQNRPIGPGYPGNRNDSAPIGPDIRALTAKERSLIQTFPESFHFFGTKTSMEQMIGNAVPVNLAKHVAKAIMQYEAGR